MLPVISPLSTFLSLFVIYSPGEEIALEDLYNVYVFFFLQQNMEEPMGPVVFQYVVETQFYLVYEKKELTSFKYKRGVRYSGLGFLSGQFKLLADALRGPRLSKFNSALTNKVVYYYHTAVDDLKSYFPVDSENYTRFCRLFRGSVPPSEETIQAIVTTFKETQGREAGIELAQLQATFTKIEKTQKGGQQIGSSSGQNFNENYQRSQYNTLDLDSFRPDERETLKKVDTLITEEPNLMDVFEVKLPDTLDSESVVVFDKLRAYLRAYRKLGGANNETDIKARKALKEFNVGNASSSITTLKGQVTRRLKTLEQESK